MKYMPLIGGAEDGWDYLSEADQGALYAQTGAWRGEHEASGEIIEGHQLQSASTATTVRRDPAGAVTITDGPFVEGKERAVALEQVELLIGRLDGYHLYHALALTDNPAEQRLLTERIGAAGA